jgi:lipoate-protein ligase A
MTASPKPSDEIQAMTWLDLTLATPAENLACDEALLDLCEEAGVEILRFWESREPFVVVGYGNRVASEVNVEECEQRGVPILRRCSGGGTVVQGPGCLNYNLTLRIPESGPLTTVTGTNELVMERNRAALEALLGMTVTVQGHTDLAFSANGWLKFSGNAQRRRRHSLVFHGTILYGFDRSLIDALLQFPSQQPGYRSDRSHADFVRNIPVAAAQICEHLRQAWRADKPFTTQFGERLEPLLREHYLNPAWNFRR